MLTTFAIFAILQLADLGTTVAALILGGVEANPLVRHLMTIGSMNGLLVAKAYGVAIGLAVACMAKPRHHTLHHIFFAVNLLFAGVVVWNVGVIVTLMI